MASVKRPDGSIALIDFGQTKQMLGENDGRRRRMFMVSNVYFHPYLGKIPILTNIFKMG